MADAAVTSMLGANGQLGYDLRHLLQGPALAALTISRGFAWLYTGTHDSLLEVTNFITTLQHRQDLMVARPEDVPFSQDWIDTVVVARPAPRCKKAATASICKC